MKTNITLSGVPDQTRLVITHYILLIALLTILGTLSSNAQTRRDTLKQNYINRLHRQYSIAPRSAAQFVELEENYRANYLQVLNDKNTDSHAKALAIDQLMRDKNAQLSGLLTPEQTLRLVPLREITRNTDSLIQLNSIRYFVVKLGVNAGTARNVSAIYQNYTNGINAAGRDDSKSVAEATNEVSGLKQQKYLQLKALLPPEKLAILYPVKQAPKNLPVIPKEMIAVSDAFQNRIRQVASQKSLSQHVRQAELLQLFKQRSDTLRKMAVVYGIKMQ